MKRVRVKFEWRDWWVGVYIADDAVYVCVVPCFPVIWRRR